MLDAKRHPSAVSLRSPSPSAEIGPRLVAVDAATLGLAVTKRPRPSPGGAFGAGQRRGRVVVGAEAGRVPVGGRLVRERGDGVLDADGEAARVLAFIGPQRGAERDPRARRAWGGLAL